MRAEGARSLQRAASPLLSLHPKGRNFWDGQMVHSLFSSLPKPEWVGRGKLQDFLVSQPEPQVPAQCGVKERWGGSLGVQR
jgi:hypothetical protein